MASTRSKSAAGKAANNAPSGRSERDGKPVAKSNDGNVGEEGRPKRERKKPPKAFVSFETRGKQTSKTDDEEFESESESDFEEDAKQPAKKKKKRNADGEMLTKSGAVDKRTSKETKKNKRKDYADGSKLSGIRNNNDEETISCGGSALIVTHMKAYKEEEDSDEDDEEEVDEKKKAGDEYDKDDDEEEYEKKGIVAYKEEEDSDEDEKKMAGDEDDEDDEEEEEEEYEIGKDWGPLGTSGDPGHKTMYMLIDGKKVYTGLFFKALPVDVRSSFAVFANEALGITERKKNGKPKNGKQYWVEVESLARKVLTREQGKMGNMGKGLGFDPHRENPSVRAGVGNGEILPSNPKHWSRRGKHLFFKKNWTYANCPGFFWGGRTLSGYLRGKRITTVEQFRKWQSGYFKTPVLEDVYLHELNCRKFREHKASDVAGDWDYKGSLDELENGKLDLGGDDRVDFYDVEEEEDSA